MGACAGILPACRLHERPLGAIRIAGGRSFGLSNVAASTVNLLGYEAPEMWDAGIFDFEKYVR